MLSLIEITNIKNIYITILYLKTHFIFLFEEYGIYVWTGMCFPGFYLKVIIDGKIIMMLYNRKTHCII